MKISPLGAVLFVTAGLSLLTGCPNPQTYGTPRAVQKGQVTHTLGLEGVHISYQPGDTTNANGQRVQRDRDAITLPTLPSYHLRYGVAENMDIGVKVLNLSTLGADYKWNFLKGDVDLAINPGLQYTGIFTGDGSAHIIYLHAPLLAGVNLSDTFSIVGSLGVVGAIGVVSGDLSGRNGSAGTGVLGRGGLGLNIRTSATFALQPEVSLMRAFNDQESLFAVFGLGLTFGKHGHGPTAEAAAPPTGSSPPAPAAPGAAAPTQTTAPTTPGAAPAPAPAQ